MNVKSIALQNFRGFKDLELTLSDNLTVIIGENGAGKSSLLDSLAIMLSWAIARIRTDNGSGQRIKDTDVRNGETGATLRCEVEHKGNRFEWTQSAARTGMKNGARSEWVGVSKFADEIRTDITATRGQCSIPVMVYYGVDRVVKSIDVDTPQDRDVFQLLKTYESSLAGSTNFQSFFQWFRASEDVENESKKYSTRKLPGGEDLEISIGRLDLHLKAVRRAFSDLPMNLKEVHIRRRELAMVALKGGHPIRLDQLSDGEKCYVAMVGDLARRLSLANPVLEDPLQGEGVVLIDEIELHLHPDWQRGILKNLRTTFPNIQFVVSTHSPQVLGEVAHEDIRCLYVDSELGQQISLPTRSQGLDSNSILEELMGTRVRDSETEKALKKIFELISNDEFDGARERVAVLEGELGGEIPELIQAKTMLAMLEGSGAEY